MRFRSKLFALIFALFVITGGLVVSAEAQRRGSVTVRRTSRPVVVYRRPYYPYYWRSRFGGFYDPFYDPYYYSPYLRYQDQRILAQNELAGNRRELEQHLRKYRADGVITAKEQRELDDDYKDVREAQQRVRRYNNGYRY